MSEKKLDKLQELLVDELILKIESGEAKPSELNIARQLLKDQGYEFINTKSPLVDVMDNLPFEQKEVLTAFKKQG
jgi:hypothetical protein